MNLVHNEFTGIIEQDGEWYIGYCPEVPGANGQGKTVEECRQNLMEEHPPPSEITDCRV